MCCLGWGGECSHLSSFGMTRRQTGGGGGVGGAGAPVKWPRGDLGNAFGGPLSAEKKAWESAVRS